MESNYIEACEIAYNYYKQAIKAEGLSEARDLGDKWIFYPNIKENYFSTASTIITVSKKDAGIELFKLPDKENFQLLKEAKEVKIPEKFKI